MKRPVMIFHFESYQQLSVSIQTLHDQIELMLRDPVLRPDDYIKVRSAQDALCELDAILQRRMRVIRE